MKTCITILVALLFLLAAGGCVEPTASNSPVTTTPATDPLMSTVATPVLTGSPADVQGTPGQETLEPAQATASPGPVPAMTFLPLKTWFTYGNGTTWESEATVYRVWMNASYQKYDQKETRYITQTAPEGKKYLALFVAMYNNGTSRALLTGSDKVYVLYDNAVYSRDLTHLLPTVTADSPPSIIRIGEIEFSHKLLGGSEYVEDFGYSHGQKPAYIDPGLSNAVDGYILYEVPAGLTVDRAYARIMFPGSAEAIWKLG